MYAKTVDNRIAQLKGQIAGIRTGSELIQRGDRQATTDSANNEAAHRSDSSLKLRDVTNRKSKTSERDNTRVAGFQYKPRKPEDSLLHKVVAENLVAFLQNVRSKADGNGLPSFVIKELEKFQDCGLIRKGLALFLNVISAASQRRSHLVVKVAVFVPHVGAKE